MNLTTIADVLAGISTVCSLAVTGWVIARPTAETIPVPIESLVRQARPLKKSHSVVLFVSGLCLLVAFVLFLFSEPKSGHPALVGPSVAMLLFCQLALHHFRRVRAFEEIIKRSLPDVYSEIRG